MQILGWNTFDGESGMPLRTLEYPFWLRIWLRIPLVDRFAHPYAFRINRTLPPARSFTTSAFAYDPARRTARTLYRNRGVLRPGETDRSAGTLPASRPGPHGGPGVRSCHDPGAGPTGPGEPDRDGDRA